MKPHPGTTALLDQHYDEDLANSVRRRTAQWQGRGVRTHSAKVLADGDQPELTNAVVAARWSSRGEAGQRVMSRKDPRVSGPVAAALAALPPLGV